MRLVQFLSDAGARRVGRVSDDGRSVQVLSGVGTTYQLAQQAARERRPLAELAAAAGNSEMLDLSDLLTNRRVLAPLDHPDPAHRTFRRLTAKGGVHFRCVARVELLRSKPQSNRPGRVSNHDAFS